MLTKTFDHYKAWVLVRSRAQMRTIVEKAPKGFGADPTTYLYDVVFVGATHSERRAEQGAHQRGRGRGSTRGGACRLTGSHQVHNKFTMWP